MLRWTCLLLAATLATNSATAFDLQGHRGARGLAPENTLEGFARALEIGVTTLELDLAVTKDDVVVVSHDPHLNPDLTRGPDGHFLAARGPAIRALTFAQLRQYDVGRLKPGTRHAARFPQQQPADGARIPSLAEVFELAGRHGAAGVRFNIETKITPRSGGDAPDPQRFAALVVDAVRKAGLASRVTIQSFDWRTLVAVKATAPEIETACLTIETESHNTLQAGQPGPSPWTAGHDVDRYGGSAPALAAAAGCAVWSPYFRNVTPQTVAEARSASVKTIPWTVNETADMEPLIGMGVDGIITDYPDRLRAVMAERGMPLPAPAPRQ